MKSIRPKLPKTINPELRAKLNQYDISELQTEFGLHPTRGDLDAIENFLNIDIYIMVAGEFQPLGITRRPSHLQHPVAVREVFRELEEESFHRDRPVVILQCSFNFFHELGDFYLLPAYSVAMNFDKKWKNIWTLIVEKRWPNQAKDSRWTSMKIREMKKTL